MMLWIAEYCQRIGCTIEHFFRSAYLWKFHKDADVRHDARNFRLHGEVPPYVRDYVDKIRR